MRKGYENCCDPSLRIAATSEFPWLDQRSADPVCYAGRWYPSAENAFQASRFGNGALRLRISHMAPASAAYAGASYRQASPDDGPDAIRTMYRVMESKFSDSAMRERLLGTGLRPIVISNMRHDNLWGTCGCRKCRGRGQNRLGIILEALRADLSDISDGPIGTMR